MQLGGQDPGYNGAEWYGSGPIGREGRRAGPCGDGDWPDVGEVSGAFCLDLVSERVYYFLCF